jgi:3-hydroxyisobutyrate dehydrogenase-like beta-hydroxyacid dehydrogenase
MGQAMVKRLVADGFRLRVWDRTSEKASALPDVEACATAREAVAGAPVVMSSLANDEAVREVTFGPHGFIEAMEPDAVHVGTSTISWTLAGTLAEEHRRRSSHYLGAPVLGRPDAAERGELWIFAGGDPGIVQRCQPVLDAVSQGVLTLEDPAHAHLTKLIANFMVVNTIELLGEATALAEKAGITSERLVEMIGRTILGSPVLRGYGARIARREFEPAAFRLELGLKDVSLALAAGAELRAPLPLASLLHDHLLEAVARGRGQQDWSALAALAQEAAGLAT